MKDMTAAYLDAVRSVLGLPGHAVPQRHGFRRKGSSFLINTRGKLAAMPELPGLSPCSTRVIPEFPGQALLTPCCRVSAAANGEWLLLDAKDPLLLLETLAAQGLLAPAVCGRLREFAQLRPCFYPALRPGIGVLLRREAKELLLAAQLLEGCGAAPEGFFFPTNMNLELTTQCPLHCPQCYVHLQPGCHMPLQTAQYWLEQAGRLGVATVNLSGGETMCYPWIYEVIRFARAQGLEADVALSGYGIHDESLDRLLEAGVTGIYLSLNGPTAEINAKTRDGFSWIIRSLELLQARRFSNVWINWVVHDSNIHTFPDMLALAERYGVHGLMVMAFKPDSQNMLPSLPSAEQMQTLARQIGEYTGAVEVQIETCYSSLRALAGQRFWGNQNRGPFLGCGAGRDSFSVALDGRLTPCRHIDLREQADDLLHYWQHSPVLEQLRRPQQKQPCTGCALGQNCRHCMAVNFKLNGAIFRGDATCPLADCLQKGGEDHG